MDYCKILIFSLNGKDYAVELDYVERILGHLNIENVPQSQKFIEGIIDYGDETLTIINLLELFGYSSVDENNEDSRIIVIIDGNQRLGVKVDSVKEVTQLSLAEVEELPRIADSNKNTKVKGLIKSNGVIKILLDAKKILNFE
ncbi:chemotaxis protein CheW [uncultured Clostridium sp.]|jgi:purine-binding chemotaxis protein CheW|uniref:chemotaxis protein CheW n=1 Tax=uncultured Clostridium sp. TaxID=59620 RepID=UPI00262CC652|nr:chemotaxis protein CheW [uncultured Clostridium sp.]